jgi:hypothetical protein
MMDSRSVRNMQSSLSKQIWEIVHLVGFYYKNISRYTVLWMSCSFFLSFFLSLTSSTFHCRCIGLLLYLTTLRHNTLVGLPWTRDRPATENSTWPHKTYARDRHPYPRRDSNPKFQQSQRPQTHALDCAATGTGTPFCSENFYFSVKEDNSVILVMNWRQCNMQKTKGQCYFELQLSGLLMI